MKKFFCFGKKGFCEHINECQKCEFCDETGGEDREFNPYWERISAISERQRAKGIEIYGEKLVFASVPMSEVLRYLCNIHEDDADE